MKSIYLYLSLSLSVSIYPSFFHSFFLPDLVQSELIRFYPSIHLFTYVHTEVTRRMIAMMGGGGDDDDGYQWLL